MKHFVTGCMLLFILPVFLAAQITIEEAARKAQSTNLGIIKAHREVKAAEKELKGELYLKNSSVSLEGGYKYLSPAAEAASLNAQSGFSGTIGITLPFVPQASLSGDVKVEEDGDFSETISLSLKPFLSKDPLYPEEQRYGKALVQLKYLLQKVYNDAEQAALDIVIRNMERDLARGTLELEQLKYEVVQQQLEHGEVSFQDVQTQLVDLNEVQESLFTMELQLLKDRQTLSLLFAPKEVDTAIEPVALGRLQELIRLRTEEISLLEISALSSEKLETLILELKALRAERKATPRWIPDTEASAIANLPKFSFSIALNFSFSPGELNNDEVEELEAEIVEKEMDIQAEIFSIGLQKNLLQQSIEISRQALTSALLQLEKDNTSLQESELLFQQGRRTSLDLEQVKLNVERSGIQSFKAAAGIYKAQSDFLMLFLK